MDWWKIKRMEGNSLMTKNYHLDTDDIYYKFKEEPNRFGALDDPEILYGFLAAVYGDSHMIGQFKHLSRLAQGRGAVGKGRRFNDRHS